VRWDIFCKVIDNFGDIGVCWRLSADLAARGEQVRLWVDDASALAWMAPLGCPGVEVRPWAEPIDLTGWTAGDVLVESFGCEIAPEIIANYAYSTGTTGLKHVWINLEYLSAESFVERSHGLPSPVMTEPGAGLTKHFFYPGFTAGTGGLIREEGLTQRQAAFDREAWLGAMGIPHQGQRLVSLFCYEPPALDALLDALVADGIPTQLLVTAGRAQAAVLASTREKKRLKSASNINSSLSISYLPPLTQFQFDELLWACDLNFVRGEDSLVRAIWAGKPLVWQIYPQIDGAHHAKLNAFLDMLGADTGLCQMHTVWNGPSDGSESASLPELALQNWQAIALATCTRLLQQDSLATQLINFVAKNR
jgi:uncharacterized repeat protein (TIGR03837 family)